MADAKDVPEARWLRTAGTTVRWGFASGLAGVVGNAVATRYDRTGWSGAITFVGMATVGVYGAFIERRIAGRRAAMVAEAEGRRLMAAAEAEGRRLMIEAEVSADRAALAEARRLHAECEARYDDVFARLGRLEALNAETTARLEALRDSIDAERREQNAAMREALKKINDQLRRDNPGGAS
jgi:hypothetical protein